MTDTTQLEVGRRPTLLSDRLLSSSSLPLCHRCFAFPRGRAPQLRVSGTGTCACVVCSVWCVVCVVCVVCVAVWWRRDVRCGERMCMCGDAPRALLA